MRGATFYVAARPAELWKPADVKRRGMCEDDDANERRFKESVKVSVCLPNFKAEGEVPPPHARGRHNSINTIAGR